MPQSIATRTIKEVSGLPRKVLSQHIELVLTAFEHRITIGERYINASGEPARDRCQHSKPIDVAKAIAPFNRFMQILLESKMLHVGERFICTFFISTRMKREYGNYLTFPLRYSGLIRVRRSSSRNSYFRWILKSWARIAANEKKIESDRTVQSREENEKQYNIIAVLHNDCFDNAKKVLNGIGQWYG